MRGDLTKRSGLWKESRGWSLAKGMCGRTFQGLPGVKHCSELEQLLKNFGLLENLKVQHLLKKLDL